MSVCGYFSPLDFASFCSTANAKKTFNFSLRASQSISLKVVVLLLLLLVVVVVSVVILCKNVSKLYKYLSIVDGALVVPVSSTSYRQYVLNQN